eukprot:Skav213995  [mRNA]  locus=scaffold941:5336:5659:+ [translate_table: standard]
MNEVNGGELLWNRRCRQRIDRGARVIIHLFSGKDEKTWKQLEDDRTVVLCLDKVLNPKMNLMNYSVMLYLMKLAASGRAVAVIRGPPCRTISACRYAGDGGPGPLRS